MGATRLCLLRHAHRISAGNRQACQHLAGFQQRSRLLWLQATDEMRGETGKLIRFALRNLACGQVSVIDHVMLDRFSGLELNLVGSPALNCLFESMTTNPQDRGRWWLLPEALRVPRYCATIPARPQATGGHCSTRQRRKPAGSAHRCSSAGSRRPSSRSPRHVSAIRGSAVPAACVSSTASAARSAGPGPRSGRVPQGFANGMRRLPSTYCRT